MQIKTDQQITAQAHAFPAHKQQGIIIGQHQHQHEENEQIQVPEETVVAVIMRHVPDGVHVNQKADARHDQDHHGAERVEQKSPVGREPGQPSISHVERQSRKPGELPDFIQTLRQIRQLGHCARGENERQQHHTRTEKAYEATHSQRMLVGAVLVTRNAGVRFIVRVTVMMLIGVVLMGMGMPVFVIVLVVNIFDPGRDGDIGRRLRVKESSQEQHHGRAKQREQRDEPDVIEKSHQPSLTTSAGPLRPPARFPYYGTRR